jgi:hypothetical protein
MWQIFKAFGQQPNVNVSEIPVRHSSGKGQSLKGFDSGIKDTF